MEELLPRFQAANTQVLGISVDSIYCHMNWARDLGGVSFPLLADFDPKGEVGRSYGLYLGDAGIDDRATVIVDAGGTVRHASSVTPSGKRDIAELAMLCKEVDRDYDGTKEPIPEPAGVPDDAVLYVKSSCGFSRAALVALDNLHLGGKLPVRNVSDDEGFRAELVKIAGEDKAPCLVVGGKPMHESADIQRYLVERSSYPRG